MISMFCGNSVFITTDNLSNNANAKWINNQHQQKRQTSTTKTKQKQKNATEL